jgi:predicted aldo/keto reductase-like oxidoreductase
MPQSLTAIAAAAHAQFPKSTVEVAMDFFTKAGLVAFCGTSNDRLVKYGRRIESLVLQAEDYESPAVVEASLARLLRDATILLDGPGHVPKVPFGATGLQMPIATLGTMRFQQEWGPRIANMNMVGADVQDNLVRILKTAILDYGMNHIETARAYGSSEMQLGVALKQLMTTGVIQRSDFILQSKVNARADPAEFRKDLETTFQMLQVDYLDLFAVHGMNLEEQWEWTMGGGVDGDNCMKVVKEYVAAGKIRHVGFSTHAPTDMILKAVESGAFSYVNLHYHFIGSYTASGYGATTRGGNYDAIKLLHEKNMGIFIISPFDKGGAVYA